MKYVRICKEVDVEVNEDLSYEEALKYGHELDRDGVLEFNLYIDIVDEFGEVIDEAGVGRMKPRTTDLVVRNIDWALLREQKEYCVNEAANNAACVHIYNGLIHLFDALQDAAVDEGFATFEQVFGVEDES